MHYKCPTKDAFYLIDSDKERKIFTVSKACKIHVKECGG